MMEYSVSTEDQVSPSGGVKYLNLFSGLCLCGNSPLLPVLGLAEMELIFPLAALRALCLYW